MQKRQRSVTEAQDHPPFVQIRLAAPGRFITEGPEADILSLQRGVEANGAGLNQRPLQFCATDILSEHS
jgi:hypothetical protein